MTDLLQRGENSIQDRGLLRRGEKILVAVSGGLDSMVLLCALKKLSAKHRWKISVAHFNHQMRGRASDADEKLARKTAATMKLPIVVERADVKQFARKSKLSVEMAARKLRHEFFARAACEQKIKTIALAHHADDHVELFFLRLLRGAGGEGLAGMKWRSPSPADKKISLVRPLLDFAKSELEKFARENKIHFREDATNFLPDFLRNRIRNELLPLLRKNYQPALNKTILRLMEIIGAESDFAGEAAGKFRGKRGGKPQIKNQKSEIGKESGIPAVVCHFEKLPLAVQRRVLQQQLAELGVAVDFELIESLRQSPGVYVSVSPEFSVSRDANGKVNLREQQTIKFNECEMAVNLGEPGEVIFGGTKLTWRFGARKKSWSELMSVAAKSKKEFFDADKIGDEIILRHWRAGDRFQPIGLKSPAKLQDLLTNQKIPREQRHKLIVAESGGEIFWIEGLRISENFKLTPKTRRQLIWRWRR